MVIFYCNLVIIVYNKDKVTLQESENLQLTEKLDFLMKERCINKSELSRQSGIPYMTIINFYEKGTDNVKLSTLKKLSKYFNVSLDDLADDQISIIDSKLEKKEELDNKETFSKNLRYYMEITGKTRNTICDDLGFKYTTFTDWVNGNKYPRIDKIEMLANYFGIKKSDLIEEKPAVQVNNGQDPLVVKAMELLNKLSPDLKRIALDQLNALSKIQEKK